MSHGRDRNSVDHGALIPDGELEDVLGAVVDVTVQLDEDGAITAVADDEPPTLGYRPERLRGAPVTRLFATDAAAPRFEIREPAAFRRSVLGDRLDAVAVPFEAADGSVVPVSVSTVPHESGVTCVIEELSEQSPGRETGLLDAIADPVFVFDAEGVLERVNDAFVEFTGYQRSEVYGRTMDELLPRSADAGEPAGLSTLLDEETSEPETVELSFVTKEGAQMLTEAHVTALFEDEEYAGAVGVLRDIRERKHRERNLTMLKQVLTRVFRHNVRNELMVVTGHAGMLESQLDDEQRKHTERILETVERLLDHSEKARLIEQVIETETLYEVDLAAIVGDVVETARSEYPEAEIKADLPPTETVTAHPEIPRAVEELIENAVEHSPDQRRPQIEVWIDSQDRTHLFVEDNAGGLAGNELNVLEQGAENKLEHSSGVGLWLIRWLVEYSKAEMIVHPTDEGSVMGIRFGQHTGADQPVVNPAHSPVAKAPPHLQERSPRRFRGETVIGRMDAHSRLEDVYESLERTGGHSVLLTGEAGTGKTTLVEQFRSWVTHQESESLIATGFCSAEQQAPYHAFRQVMRDLPTDRDISALLAETQSLSVDDPAELRHRKAALFADLAAELRAVAVDQPVVLVLEDLQWADRGTIDLFEYLTEEVGQWGHPVLFLGTYRTSDVDQSHPVLEIADETAGAGRGTLIELEPFDHGEVEALLAELLGVETIPDSFVDEIHRHTGGTPLFVNEIGRHLADSLRPVQDGSELPASLAEVSVPQTVESAVAERLSALPEDVWPVLRLGAVIGRELSFDVLRAASDRPVAALIDSVDALVRRQVWKRSEDSIEFVHGLLREQTLDTIPETRLQTLHERVAAAIETVHADALDEHAAQLGRHYEAVGEQETAFEYYRQAGDHAASTYAQEAAVQEYEHALAVGRSAGAVDEDTLAAVCRDVGAVLRLTGEYDRARDHYARSRELCDATQTPAGSAESCNELGHIALRQGEYDDAREYYEQALKIAQSAEIPEQEASSLTGLGVLATHRGEFADAEQYHRQSLDIRQEIGDREGEADCFNNLGILADYRGRYEAAERYHTQSLDIREAVGDRQGEAGSLGNLGILARLRGNLDEAEQYHQESLDIREEIGDRKGQANSLDNLGIVAELRGEYDQAEQYHQESLAIEREIGDRRGEATSRNSLGSIAQSRGEYDQAEQYYRESLAIEREIGDRNGQAKSLQRLGTIAYHRGNDDRAREWYRESYELFQEIGESEGKATTVGKLGQLARRRGEYDRAEEKLSRALEIARDVGLVGPTLGGLRELAAVERCRGNYEKATEYIQESLAADEEGEQPEQRAKTQLERTRLALARGDLETAHAAIDRADEILSSLDATHRDARATLLRGRVAAAAGKHTEACESWQTALAVFEEIGAVPDALQTLRLLADTAQEHGDEKQAQQYRHRARQLSEDAPAPVRESQSWLGESGE